MKKKLVKENFYLFLMAALIGFICNYFVTKTASVENFQGKKLNPIMEVFKLPSKTDSHS